MESALGGGVVKLQGSVQGPQEGSVSPADVVFVRGPQPPGVGQARQHHVGADAQGGRLQGEAALGVADEVCARPVALEGDHLEVVLGGSCGKVEHQGDGPHALEQRAVGRRAQLRRAQGRESRRRYRNLGGSYGGGGGVKRAVAAKRASKSFFMINFTFNAKVLRG